MLIMLYEYNTSKAAMLETLSTNPTLQNNHNLVTYFYIMLLYSLLFYHTITSTDSIFIISTA